MTHLLQATNGSMFAFLRVPGSWALLILLLVALKGNAQEDPDISVDENIFIPPRSGTVSVLDTDGDGMPNDRDMDDDNDGMPDSCEIRYGFDPLNPADGGDTNTDGDGASNVHECRHGTDPTATPANTVLPDRDGDGMYDAWESNNGLDSRNPADASLDDDGDGYTNLEEFRVRTDPRWDLSHPHSIPDLSFGFGDSYTAELGLVNSGDAMLDIVIRDPTKGVLPSVSEFVLLQTRAGGFDLKDAQDYTMPASLTDITSHAVVVDINGDHVKDMVLTSLDDYIAGARDLIVLGDSFRRYDVPDDHVIMSERKKKFFAELSAWIDDEAYFEEAVAVSSRLRINTGNEIQTNEIPGTSQFSIFGQVAISDVIFQNYPDHCVGLSPVNCYTLGSEGFWGPLDPIYTGDIRINLSGENRLQFAASGGSTNLPATVQVFDISNFDQDARLLALYYLAPIRDSGSLLSGSTVAKTISDVLETVLGFRVLNGSLLGPGNGVLIPIEDPASQSGAYRDTLRVLKLLRDRIVLPPPQHY